MVLSKKSFFKVFLLILIIFFPVQRLSAFGKKVLSLREIDRLIADTNYDVAMEELNRYISTYPENFDNAQIRINRIITARRRYAELAQILIQVVINEPDDSEKIYRITSELQALEKYPSDKQLDFIKQTRIAAQFNFFRKEYNRLQEATESNIQNGNYVAAVDSARNGFYLYQDDFWEEQTDAKITGPVRQSLSDIDRSIAEYKEIQKRLNDSVTAYLKAVDSEKVDDITKSFVSVRQAFRDFSVIRNRVYEAGETFRTVQNQIAIEAEKHGELDSVTDASFLPFVIRFTLGLSSNEKTGIAGAMDTQWLELCGKMDSAVTGKLDSYVIAFEKSLPENLASFSDLTFSSVTKDTLSKIRNFSIFGKDVVSLNDYLLPADFSEESYQKKVIYDFSYSLPENLSLLFTERANLLSRISDAEKIKAPSNPVEVELDSRNRENRYAQNLWNAAIKIPLSKENDASFVLEKAEWAKDYPTGSSEDKLLTLEELYKSYVAQLDTLAQDALLSFGNEICTYYKDTDSVFLQNTKDSYALAELNYKGIENAELFTTERYPDKSLSMAKKIQGDVDTAVKAIERHINHLDIMTEYAPRSETRRTLVQTQNALLALKDASVNLASLSNSQILSANKALNEAVLRLNQSERALNSSDFDTARKRLQDSRQKYNESLSLAFSQNIQNESDEKLASLGNKINQKENEFVVREVRNLKTQAKNEYYNGNFEQAEALLNQAKNRWAVTNVDEDAEITNLLAVVNTALSMKTGRVILPSAPLYPEMSQILSIASMYYQEGESLVKQGRQAEAEAKMDEALKKLQELQLVYPLNQEAALLTLRIQKVLRPDEFEAMFERKVAAARVNYKNKETQQQAYSDLLDLAEINPNYPGLKDLIYNIELEIGIRQKPVDNSALVKSNALTKEAQTIVNSAGRDENKLKAALTKVDEAIELNPNNNVAILLKDQIQTKIGGKAAVVLSSEDEARYQRAIQEMQKNNVITANAIVEQLLQKKANRNSSKILELQKKIKALL